MQEKIQKISPIKQKILQFIEYLGISKRDFYTFTGISRGTLESATGITEDTLYKFINKYPKVNIEWLLKDKGNMTNDAYKNFEEPEVKYNDTNGEMFRLKFELENANKKIDELREELLSLYRKQNKNERLAG